MARFEAPPIDDGTALTGVVTEVLVGFWPELNDPQGLMVGKPQWRQLPARGQFKPAMDKLSADGLASALVVLDCHVAEGGVLGGCIVASESPSNHDLGPIALRLAPSFRMAVWTEDGAPAVGARLRLPIRLQLQEPSAPPAP
jgi:hypothetical protein